MMFMHLIIMLLKNSQGEEHVESSHIMNWLVQQIISMMNKYWVKEDLAWYIEDF